MPLSNPFTFVRSLWRILRGRPQVPPSLADNPLLEMILKRRSVRSFTHAKFRTMSSPRFWRQVGGALDRQSAIVEFRRLHGGDVARHLRSTVSLSGPARHHRDG